MIQRSDRRASTVPGMEHISLEPPGEDEFTSAVYGSSFASMDLPEHEMPEKEMPKEIAYRMIKDHLSLDGNPMLKWVSHENTEWTENKKLLTRTT